MPDAEDWNHEGLVFKELEVERDRKGQVKLWM
jgi:hypothetical protein